MFPLALLNAASPPVLPTGILLFNGTNGATTATNTASNPIGTIGLWNNAVISTAQAYEGSASLYLHDTGNGFLGYYPAGDGGNSTVTGRSFYISVAFRLKYASDSSQRGLIYVNNTSGIILFRAYIQNGQVNCFIRQVNGTTYTVTVPNLNCAVDTWYKLEISRDIATSQFKVKVGVDEVTQTLTADFANPINRVDAGAYWDGASFIGYFDRFIYQMGSTTPY